MLKFLVLSVLFLVVSVLSGGESYKGRYLRKMLNEITKETTIMTKG